MCAALLADRRPERTPTELRESVEALTAQILGLSRDEVGAATRIAEDCGLDSYDLLDFATEVEARFGIHVGDGALSDAESVADLVECVLAAARRPARVRRG